MFIYSLAKLSFTNKYFQSKKTQDNNFKSYTVT